VPLVYEVGLVYDPVPGGPRTARATAEGASVSECEAARPHGSVVPEPESDERDVDRSPFLPRLDLPGPSVWGCPEASCQFREAGRMERAGGDGVCPQHRGPLVRVDQ
jgi:hypothetical protein